MLHAGPDFHSFHVAYRSTYSDPSGIPVLLLAILSVSPMTHGVRWTCAQPAYQIVWVSSSDSDHIPRNFNSEIFDSYHAVLLLQVEGESP